LQQKKGTNNTCQALIHELGVAGLAAGKMQERGRELNA
jgi:hypothetical protein